MNISMCMVTTARYTQPELRHAMETLDDEVFYAEHLHAHHFEMVFVLCDPPIHGIEDLVVEGFHGVS